MQNSFELQPQIENVRNTMLKLMEADLQLVNPEILSISQTLDQLLNQLHDFKNAT